MTRSRFGIAFRLIGGLLTVVAATTLVSLAGFFALYQVGQQFSWTAHSEVPRLVAASRLSHESQRIAFIGPTFRKIDNHFTLATKMGEADDKLASLENLIQSFSSLGADSAIIEDIRATRDLLRQHFARLAEVVGHRIDAESEIQARWNMMVKLGEEIRAQSCILRGAVRHEAPDWLPIAAWTDVANALVSNSIAILGYKNRSQLKGLATRLDDLWHEAEVQYGRMTPNMQARLSPLRKMLAENADTSPNFAKRRLQLLEAEQAEVGMVNRAEILSSSLVIAATDLFVKTQNEVDGRNTKVADIINKTSRLLAGAVAFTLLVSILMLLYINRSVILRLTALRTAMTDHAQGGGGPIEIAGNDEIGEMSSALRYFVGVIKNRENKLHAINADLSQAHSNLEKIAVTDRLTGLYNRAKLDEVFTSEIACAERLGNPFAIIMADIDHFKLINDTHGHLVGDSVLNEFATILRRMTRDTDTAGRWGGEEFLVICPKVELNDAFALAERIRAAVAKHSFPVVGKKTCSFGVASYRLGDTADTMVKRADEALYKAKQHGRDRVATENRALTGNARAE